MRGQHLQLATVLLGAGGREACCGELQQGSATPRLPAPSPQVGGGKPKMRHYFSLNGWPTSTVLGGRAPADEAEQAQLIDALQDWKTEKYKDIIGALPIIQLIWFVVLCVVFGAACLLRAWLCSCCTCACCAARAPSGAELAAQLGTSPALHLLWWRPLPR